jgi:hypothetical protein
MKRVLLMVFLVLTVLAAPVPALEVGAIRSSDELARFIYRMAAEDMPVSMLLEGIESKESLSIREYGVSIPVREIFGTIVSERFGDKIDRQLFESDKTYESREICAFGDSNDLVWRFHITIWEDRQYMVMKRFLEKEMEAERQK